MDICEFQRYLSGIYRDRGFCKRRHPWTSVSRGISQVYAATVGFCKRRILCSRTGYRPAGYGLGAWEPVGARAAAVLRDAPGASIDGRRFSCPVSYMGRFSRLAMLLTLYLTSKLGAPPRGKSVTATLGHLSIPEYLSGR